ncbi:hypothetical protein F8R90_22955 [Nostoc sp. NZL]|nr:hypothetical protein [Nostoc sp. NZL]
MRAITPANLLLSLPLSLDSIGHIRALLGLFKGSDRYAREINFSFSLLYSRGEKVVISRDNDVVSINLPPHS